VRRDGRQFRRGAKENGRGRGEEGIAGGKRGEVHGGKLRKARGYLSPTQHVVEKRVAPEIAEKGEQGSQDFSEHKGGPLVSQREGGGLSARAPHSWKGSKGTRTIKEKIEVDLVEVRKKKIKRKLQGPSHQSS